MTGSVRLWCLKLADGMPLKQTVRMIVAGLYVLAMLVVAVMPATAASAMHAPTNSVAAISDCDTGTGAMSHGTAKASDDCGAVGHPASGTCVIGSVCADLPSGVVAGVAPSRALLSDGQRFPVSSPSLSGLDPGPGLRPPCLSA